MRISHPEKTRSTGGSSQKGPLPEHCRPVQRWKWPSMIYLP
ncbi:hypothetical protein ANCCAN_07862 [Ancylostoma caninum]|uniref:Uncharacterized protein n=1 Tax=Ancylostoma caninum TaxID=29170 RepID=A0A368GSS5_ANCCA|nr:hypothetical protein ANCCAN_07862 [Ancylostoma caninum]